MSAKEARFATGVRLSDAVLPEKPLYWSYSSLKDAEACPRRFALSRAQYPDLWDQWGYPQVPAGAALFGDVVHASLEIIVRRMIAAGCASIKVDSAVEVLRDLGGYTAVVESAILARLARLDGNPRLDPERLRRIGLELGDRLPAARAEVQTYLSRTRFPLPLADDPKVARADGMLAQGGAMFGRRAAETGTHSETPVASDSLRLMGRIDLLTISADQVGITDFKTGAQDPAHVEQLRLYALLWNLDDVVNPEGRPVAELTASYPTIDVRIPAPDKGQLRKLEASLRERIGAADVEVSNSVPEARPSAENCKFCHVRQLCDDYWRQVPEPVTHLGGAWFDYQGMVGPQNGARSWWMLRERDGQRQVLLRTYSASQPLVPGTRIRVLGVRLDDDPEVAGTVVALSGSSEIFVLSGER